jgi:transposase
MAKATAPKRQYTEEFKVEALRLGESIGINQAAKRLGIPASSLGNWVRLKRSGKLSTVPRVSPIKGSAAELEAENNRLRRELANAKLDLEIVKKAAAYFAKESR